MYQITVEAVRGRHVISGGKQLVCIGNATVHVGDNVWTDGKCVYGHHQTGSESFVPTALEEKPLSAVPILLGGGQYLFYDKGKGLQTVGIGAVHDAMVNQRGGYTFIDLPDILDAERDSEGNIYVIRKGHYALRKVTEYELPNYEIKDYLGAVNVTSEFYPDFNGEPDRVEPGWEPQASEEYIDCMDSYVYSRDRPGEENVPVQITKNGEIIASIDLSTFRDDGMETKVAEYAAEVEESMATDVEEIYPSFRTQPEAFLKGVEIKVASAKVDTSGNYILIVDVSAEQIFFPWIAFESPRYSITAHNVKKNLDSRGGRVRYEHTETLTPVGGMVKAWLHASAKYIRRLKITPKGIETIKAECTASILGPWLHIDSGVSDRETIWHITEREVCDGLSIETAAIHVSPHDSRFLGSWAKDVRGWISGEEIYETSISAVSNDEVIMNTGIEACHLTLYPTRNSGSFAKKVDVEEKKVALPMQDGFYYVPGEGGIKSLYAADGIKLAEEEFSADVNFCACRVSDQSCLVGVHGEKLYYCRDGKLRKIADGLRNYRLRSMDNMSNWMMKGEQ